MSAHPLTLEARWSSPSAPEVWTRLVALKSSVDNVVKDDDLPEFVVVGPVLSTEESVRVARLIVSNDEAQGVVYWLLKITAAPLGPPPESVRAEDAKIGGWPGLQELIRGALGESDTRCHYVATLTLSASEWSCLVLPREAGESGVDAVAARLGGSARVEQIGYRFDVQDDGLSEVVIAYLHERNLFQVTLLVTASLGLQDPMLMRDAENRVSPVRQSLFCPKELSHESA